MTDENSKPIKLPRIELVHGFEIHCDNPRCGPIGFEKKRIVAEAKRAKHLKYHQDHEELMRKHLESLQEAQDEAATSGVVLLPKLHCPTCYSAIGEPHTDVCDIARCLSTGAQRRLRSHIPALETGEGNIDDPHHNCGLDVWTGYYPGEREAAVYGVPTDVLKRYGYWSATKVAWVLDEGWEEKANAPGKAD